MKRITFRALVIALVAVAAGAVEAKQKSLAGSWTFTVEQFPMKLVLEQRNTTVSGTLSWPHGEPIKLSGGVKGDELTFSGDSQGENFTVHVDAKGRLQPDGSLKGAVKARFIDFNEAHEVVRTHDQDIQWTAVRGLEAVERFHR